MLMITVTMCNGDSQSSSVVQMMFFLLLSQLEKAKFDVPNLTAWDIPKLALLPDSIESILSPMVGYS